MSTDAWEWVTRGPEQTMAVGRMVAGACCAGDMVLLIGDLGAGKTQFVRGLAAGLGLNPAGVSSPTFVFMHEYEPADGQGLILVHVDAYRLHDSDELPGIGWTPELFDGAVVAMEWADRVPDAWPADCLEVQITHDGDDCRTIRLIGRGSWQARLASIRSTSALRKEHDGKA